MFSKYFELMTITILVLVFCLAIDQPRGECQEKTLPASTMPEKVQRSATSPKEEHRNFSHDQDKKATAKTVVSPVREAWSDTSYEKKLIKLIDHISRKFADWSRWLEISILILTAAVFVASLITGFTSYQTLSLARSLAGRIDEKMESAEKRIKEHEERIDMKLVAAESWGKDEAKRIDRRSELAIQKINDQSERLERKLEAINAKVIDQVELALGKRLGARLDAISRQAQSWINDFIEQDFSESLEKRYLSMEYVRNGIWIEIATRVTEALHEGNFQKAVKLWNLFFRAQLSLRQLLSADQIDIFTGLGNLRVMTDMALVPKESLANLITILRKEKRFSWENERFARSI